MQWYDLLFESRHYTYWEWGNERDSDLFRFLWKTTIMHYRSSHLRVLISCTKSGIRNCAETSNRRHFIGDTACSFDLFWVVFSFFLQINGSLHKNRDHTLSFQSLLSLSAHAWQLSMQNL